MNDKEALNCLKDEDYSQESNKMTRNESAFLIALIKANGLNHQLIFDLITSEEKAIVATDQLEKSINLLWRIGITIPYEILSKKFNEYDIQPDMDIGEEVYLIKDDRKKSGYKEMKYEDYQKVEEKIINEINEITE